MFYKSAKLLSDFQLSDGGRGKPIKWSNVLRLALKLQVLCSFKNIPVCLEVGKIILRYWEELLCVIKKLSLLACFLFVFGDFECHLLNS